MRYPPGFLDTQWRCGDCGRAYPKSRDYCNHYFDDYLALRGGSIETAIARAVDTAINPLVEQALSRLSPGTVLYVSRYKKEASLWTR